MTTIKFDRLPGGNRLFLDYLYDPQRIGAFFPWPFRSEREFESCARMLDEHPIDRGVIANILRRQNEEFQADEHTLINIDRLRGNEALVVFTGQQVGLYGGPLYTVLKALGAIGWAKKLEAKLKRPVIPMFWLAADDHDFAEVQWTAFPDLENRVCREIYEPETMPERIPTSRIGYDHNINRVHEQWRASRLETEFSQDIDRALAGAFRPGATMAVAFATWMANVFAGTGLVFFSPSDPEAKQLAVRLFEQELCSPKCAAKALDLVNMRLSESGYRQQVTHPPANTHLFYFNGQRVPLNRLTDGNLTDGLNERPADDWVKVLYEHPEDFSPGVLFRPVLQNYLFPTVAYIAGPSEVAYWAQARALFEVFSVVQPVVIPRPFATLVERKIRKAVDKLELSLPEVLIDPEAVVNRVAQRSFPVDLQAMFSEVHKCFGEYIGKLEKAVTAFEPTLQKPFRISAGKMKAEVATLEKKAFQAHKRNNEIIREQVYKIAAHLYPDGKLQERVFGLPYYLNKYGMGLVAYLTEQIRLDTGDHQLIELKL